MFWKNWIKIWDRQTPPPSVGPKSQIFPKIRFEGSPKDVGDGISDRWMDGALTRKAKVSGREMASGIGLMRTIAQLHLDTKALFDNTSIHPPGDSHDGNLGLVDALSDPS